MKAEHKRRVATSFVGLFVIIVADLSPTSLQLTLVAVVAVSVFTLREAWALLGRSLEESTLKTVIAVSTVLLIAMAARQALPLLIVSVVGPMAICLWVLREGHKESRARLTSAILCLALITLPMGCVVAIRNGPHGAMLVWFLLSVACFSDIGALYTGKLIGRHKMAPETSPNKTWEGSFGGLAFSLVIIVAWAAGYRWLCNHEGVLWLPAGWLSWVEICALTLVVTALAQLGDLVESMLKRDAAVKDSGSSLTGHGGLLDMVDSVLWAAPSILVYIACRGMLT